MSLLLSTSRKGLVGGDPPAVPAAAARRLSAIQRDAATLALAALHRAGTERPDAIIASTALGCLDDTERFLADMHDANGALLSPLPFMRSTHNTMAGQLALMLGCHGPNITHAQGLDGFHASLVEAELLLHEHPEWRILVLAIDERTELLDRVAEALTPDPLPEGQIVAVGQGGEAFVLTDDADVPCIARVGWWDGTVPNPAILIPDGRLPIHGSIMAQDLGQLLVNGIDLPLLLGARRSSGLIVSPC